MMKRRDALGKFGLRCLGAVAVFALWTATAQAHKPLMMIEDNEDGTITVGVGFSDGESGAGAPIVLKAMADGRTLWEGELDARGELVCPKQAEPYVVRFIDDEPGHSAERAGIVLKPGEPAPTLGAAVAVPGREIRGGHAAEEKAPSAAKGSESILHPQWALPLSADVSEELQGLMSERTVSVQNVLGLVRTTSLLQCLQQHAQSKMGAMVATAEERLKAGRKVDFELPKVGLCPGSVSGFLAVDFAIRELYGENVPVMDDLRIECKGKMGGIWDSFELILGRRLSRERGVMGPSPEAFVFVAERLSDGRRVVFAYHDDVKAKLARFFDARVNPDELPAGEMKRIRQELVGGLLARRNANDFGYFTVLEGASLAQGSGPN